MAQSLTNRSRLLEKYVQVVREDGLNTNKNVNIGINGSTPNVWIGGNLSVGGTISGDTGLTGAQTITAASANALAVGPNGTTNPTFNVNTNTANAATGLDIVGAAAAGGLAVSVLSSGTNEALTIDAKGSGSVKIASVSTGNVSVGSGNGSVFQIGGGDISIADASGTLQLYSAFASKSFKLYQSAATTTNTFGVALDTGVTTVTASTATTAGGSLGLQFGTTANLGIFYGSGAPTIASAQGALYIRSDGGATNTRLYVNGSTATNTWVAVTTAS
jgi:hypothetical protein